MNAIDEIVALRAKNARLRAQLLVAKRALRTYAAYIPLHPDLVTVEETLAAMRKAGRK
jgi:hypothetical protein